MDLIVPTIQRLWADRRGNVLVLAAASCGLVVGAAGLATDTVQWSLMRRQLQQAADAAAISGAYARAKGEPVTAAAQKELTALAKVTLSTPATIENAPTVGTYAGDASSVRVYLQASVNLPFSRLFMPGAFTIPAQATGKVVSMGDYCLLALEKVATGISFTGNGTLNLGCGLASNSKSSTAIDASGSASVNATTVVAAGGITAGNKFNTDAKFYRNSISQPDPYAGLPTPFATSMSCSGQVKVNNNASKTIDPGCYRGFDVKGTLYLNPGIYYIDGSTGGQFSVGAQGSVIGANVTIILTSATAATAPSTIAVPDIDAGATLNLTNTTAGTYAGVLFYQDRRALDNTTNLINGNVGSTFQGAIYFPSQAISFSGNSGITMNCLQFIAKRVSFTGNSNITNVCPLGSGAGSFKGLVVRLVE